MPRHVRPVVVLVVAIGVSTTAVLAQVLPAQPSEVRQGEAARESREKVPEIFDAMAVRPGAVVADVGAGGGFLTVRLARAVGSNGRVIAVDVNARVLERLRARVQQEGFTNVEIVKGDVDDPHVPPSSLDAAVIVNSYHEMRDYHAMLHHLRRGLKPDARLVIVEPISEKRRGGSREQQTAAHEIAARFVEEEAREAGFRIQRLQDPFTTRDTDIMWLLVAVPEPLVSAHGAVCSLPVKAPARLTPSPETDDDSAGISNPDLRIAFDRFKKLRDEGAIVVLDVRTEDEFRSGHIPGAIWIPHERVGEHAAQLRVEGKPIITYCG